MRAPLVCTMQLTIPMALLGRYLEAYFIDVEGGKATLIVSPAGESLLIDTGLPGFRNRDAGRIAEAVKAAGLRKIDNLVITHFHRDHVAGVRQLAARLLPQPRTVTLALPPATLSSLRSKVISTA